MSDASEFLRLTEIVRRLRQPDGCPWDRAQTHESIRKNLVEETGEFLDALEDGNLEGIREELGDILLQVVFHAQMGAEAGEYTMEEICREEADKLIRRHPHVFGTAAKASSAKDALGSWERSKVGEAGEQSRRVSALDGVPRSMPGLSRAQKTLVKASRKGFRWQSDRDALAKVEEELSETKEALAQGDKAAFAREAGDLLFAVTSLCQTQDVEAEEALHNAIARFHRRFRSMEAETKAAGHSLGKNSPREWLRLWEKAKAAEKAD